PSQAPEHGSGAARRRPAAAPGTRRPLLELAPVGNAATTSSQPSTKPKSTRDRRATDFKSTAGRDCFVQKCSAATAVAPVNWCSTGAHRDRPDRKSTRLNSSHVK